MKTLTSLRPLALAILTAPLISFAQEKTRFVITDPIHKSTYNGEKLKKMKFKDLKAALMSTGDEQVIKDVRSLETKHHVGGAFLYIGTGMLLAGSAMNLANTSNQRTTGGWGKTPTRSSSNPGMGLIAGGVVVELIGVFVHSGYKKTLKHAIYRHNDVIGGASFAPGTTSINGQLGLGGTLSFTF